MRQNKQMEVAVVSVEQLHQEFEWMKEQLKKEILLDVEKLGSKELLTRQQLADYLSYVWSELGKALFNVEMLREASLVDIDRNKMFEPDNNNMSGSVSFAYKGVLANTDYDNICAKIKDVFVDNYREKSAFFSNQQKFPVYYTQLWGGSMK
ncbi:hypothetical protein N9X14_00740 [bacterium]|nr:hypothetical protein [bacterium]